MLASREMSREMSGEERVGVDQGEQLAVLLGGCGPRCGLPSCMPSCACSCGVAGRELLLPTEKEGSEHEE